MGRFHKSEVKVVITTLGFNLKAGLEIIYSQVHQKLNQGIFDAQHANVFNYCHFSTC